MVPVPRGVPTLAELRDPVRAGWEEDRAALHDLIERFAAEDRAGRWPPHPAFGTLSGRGWGSLAYKHLDHHLRQFGV